MSSTGSHDGDRLRRELVGLGEALSRRSVAIDTALEEMTAASRPALSPQIEQIFREGAQIAVVAVGAWIGGATPEETRSIGRSAALRYATLAAQREIGMPEAMKRMLLWRDCLLREIDSLVGELGLGDDTRIEARHMVRRSLDISLIYLCGAYETELNRMTNELVDRQNQVGTQAKLAEERLEELRVAQAELVQAQKMESVGQLAAGIAHEINTPMQYIGDNVSFLKRALDRLLAIATAAEAVAAPDAGDDQRVDLARLLEKSRLAMLRGRGPKAVDDALTGVETVSRIVTAMKRFSHPGSDELELVDVNESLKTTITVCRHEWKYSAELETHLADDLPLIAGSRGLLNQVWLNMIVNSCHAIVERHGDGKGVITITTEGVDDDRGARITIADDGAGIDPANIDRIFDHFFTTKEVGKGTGQGLAFAHRTIVAEHHGTLSVESTLGEGTTFVVTLPVERPPEACPTP